MFSVIVPTWNEEIGIRACVESALREATPEIPIEVLVVDGGSQDRTREIAEARGARVLLGPKGRALQQNFGARHAQGDVLVFLHGDMVLPRGWAEALEKALEDPEVPGGGFFKSYCPSTLGLSLVAFLQNQLRAKVLRHLVGTNAFWVRSQVFWGLGGFPEVPFLEDVIFSDRLRSLPKSHLVEAEVQVSSRKYLREGVLLRTLKNLWILCQFRVLGRSPQELLAQYQAKSPGESK